MRFGSWGREKKDARSSEMMNIRHGRKHYESPKCTEMSISEMALLLRGKTVGHKTQSGGAGLPDAAEVPVLFVQGYVGNLDFIRPVVRAPARELAPFATKRGIGWLEMQFAAAELTEPQSSFLLLDLRNRYSAARSFFESLGHGLSLNETAPRVILAASSEQFLGWTGFDPKQCWQLRSCQTPEDLSTALHSFLYLCSMFRNWPADENTELDPSRDHAFSGRIDKE